MIKNVLWLIFLFLMFSFWIYDLYFFFLELKGGLIPISLIIGNVVVKLYILGSLIYIFYIRFWK